MLNLDFLSKEATTAQIAKNAVVASNKSVSKKAEKTFMNSSIMRRDALTDTARLDFVLSTAFVLCDFHVTTQQVVALATAVNLDSKRLQSATQIAKHCKDNEICNVDASLLTITDERLQQFYRDAFFSRDHATQLVKYAEKLSSVVIDYIANSEHIENAHDQALSMHAEFIKQSTKKTRKSAKK